MQPNNASPLKPRTSLADLVSFTPPWTWLVDELIPARVKARYSPRENWKNKPFTQQDAYFFFKGIEELSELFTEERSGIANYFQHPKYRSAYLLYFLPLQAAKFLTLLQSHPLAFHAALEHGNRTGVLRIADLGAGPATASIATLLHLLEFKRQEGEKLPPIEIHLIDTNRHTLEDGADLISHIADHFPVLSNRVQLITTVAPWWKAPEILTGPASLTILGHVLNESSGPGGKSTEHGSDAGLQLWSRLLAKAEGAGTLIVDPASRRSSQILSQLRDRLLDSGLAQPEAASIWGPCLHARHCPLAEGRDWCHFSTPARLPGSWFKEFSKGLGSERQWLKYSYLWLASQASGNTRAPEAKGDLRRVISDPMGGTSREVLLCEPEVPGRLRLEPKSNVKRGDLITLRAGGFESDRPPLETPRKPRRDPRGRPAPSRGPRKKRR